jgi:hypothetical protein
MLLLLLCVWWWHSCFFSSLRCDDFNYNIEYSSQNNSVTMADKPSTFIKVAEDNEINKYESRIMNEKNEEVVLGTRFWWGWLVTILSIVCVSELLRYWLLCPTILMEKKNQKHCIGLDTVSEDLAYFKFFGFPRSVGIEICDCSTFQIFIDTLASDRGQSFKIFELIMFFLLAVLFFRHVKYAANDLTASIYIVVICIILFISGCDLPVVYKILAYLEKSFSMESILSISGLIAVAFQIRKIF